LVLELHVELVLAVRVVYIATRVLFAVLFLVLHKFQSGVPVLWILIAQLDRNALLEENAERII
jgi:hypothetical protein